MVNKENWGLMSGVTSVMALLYAIKVYQSVLMKNVN